MREKGTGNGTIYYSKERKQFVYQYTELDGITGKQLRKTKRFKTMEDAENYRKALNYQKENPLFIEHNGLPLGELMKMNLNAKLQTNQISQVQYDRVLRTQKKIQDSYLYNKKIDEIKSEEIQAFLNSLTYLSNSSIKKLKEQFGQAFKYAISRGYINVNPMSIVLTPKSIKKDKKVRALTFDEQEQFVEWLTKQNIEDFQYRNVFLIQMFMGLRIGEVLALRRGDIDLKHNRIKISKTLTTLADGTITMSDSPKTEAGNREVPIVPQILPYIMEQIEVSKNYENNEDEKLLFRPLNATKNIYVDRENVNNTLKTTLKKNFGIVGITTHSLRHTYGTRCIEAGMQPTVVQRNMGHTDVSVTLNIYADVFDEFKQKEQEKFNDYFMSINAFKQIPEKTTEDEEIEEDEKIR